VYDGSTPIVKSTVPTSKPTTYTCVKFFHVIALTPSLEGYGTLNIIYKHEATSTNSQAPPGEAEKKKAEKRKAVFRHKINEYRFVG
jgi:hypothetical protein